jgi:hypothetical protein
MSRSRKDACGGHSNRPRRDYAPELLPVLGDGEWPGGEREPGRVFARMSRGQLRRRYWFQKLSARERSLLPGHSIPFPPIRPVSRLQPPFIP